ncbi:MAG: plastocyanin/azurin family copper-binding protein [Gemmatimonadales bacterium]
MTRSLPLGAALLLAAAPVTAQVALDRPPVLGGTWVPDAGVVRFDFLHRFWIPEGTSSLQNSPTFTFAVGLPSRLALGVRYATNARVIGTAVETELYARWQVVKTGDVTVALTPAYSAGARSADGEVSVDWTRGRLTLSGAARGMSQAFGEDRSRGALASGAVVRLNDYVALGGDVASMVNPDPGEDPAWSVGLLFVIPGSPHTFSLQASNVTVNTIQGSSRRGTTFTDKPLYGFEFTIPLHLRRFAPWFGGGSRPAAAPPAANVGAEVEIASLRYGRDTVYVTAGQAVRWINTDPVEHTVTFEPGGPESSPLLVARDVFVARFERPGVYPYHCIPHPFMKAVVVVR